MQHGIKRRQWSRELLKQKNEEDKKKIDIYRALVKQAFEAREKKQYSLETVQLTTSILDINPEFNTVWNYRRDIISNVKDELSDEFWNNELKFTMVQLRKFPKVYWIWNHRVWILNNFPTQPLVIWKGELSIVNSLLELDSRNFHGWHYRRMVISKIEGFSDKSLNEEEFDYVTHKINKNISNYSAWHQRVQLITDMLLKNQILDKKEFIKKEIEYVTNAMFTDAEDQSVWFYILWMLKAETIKELLNEQEYYNFIKGLKENALMINEDEVDFSGKDNTWCLKIALEIELIQMNLGIEYDKNLILGYLEQLIEIDSLRKNRYKYLLSKLLQ